MKKLLYILAAGILFSGFSCNSQTEAQKKANEISSVLNQQAAAEEKPTANGEYLKATIDGKKWIATKMGPRYGADSDYKLINGETEDITITFQLHKPYSGMKRQFRDDYVANFLTDDGFFGGKKGEVTVTKADENWIEGTFYFTATTSPSNKSFEIKDGSFRVANK